MQPNDHTVQHRSDDGSQRDSERPRALHPLSLVFEFLSLARRNIVPVVFAGFSAASGGLIGLWIGLSVFGVAILASALKYFTFRYSIVAGELVVQHGLIFRQHRTIPIGRIQNIDMVQNLLHRWFDVGEVRIETASGKEPEAIMRVLAVPELRRLQSNVFGLARHADQDSKRDVDSESSPLSADLSPMPAHLNVASAQVMGRSVPQVIYQIPLRRLLLAGLCSNRGAVLIGLILGFLWQDRYLGYLGLRPDLWLDPTANKSTRRELAREILRGGSVVRDLSEWWNQKSSLLLSIGLVLAFIGIAAILIKILSMGWYVLRFHGYRLELDGNDLRVRCGLLTKVTATVPRDRIQLISVHRPLLERWLGIAHIRIETAGGGEEQEDASATVGRRWFLPVVAEQDVSTLVSQLNPRIPSEPIPLEWQPLSHRAGSRLMRWGAIVSLAIAGGGIFLRPQWGWSLGFLALAISWWFVRRKMKSRKFASADWGVVFKSGIFNLKWSTTCFDKIQSIQLLQSPFDRRWRMASLAIDTVGAGPADHTIQIDLLDEGLAREQYERISAVL